MKSPNDNQSIYWQLLQLMFQGKHRIHQIAETYGLTTMQVSTLMMLKVDEPLPMRVLSDNFMCDASNVTGLVDRLEARGLLLRQNHPTDRRIKLIVPTAAGTKMKDEILAKTVEIESVRLDKILSSSERWALQELLQRILAASPETADDTA